MRTAEPRRVVARAFDALEPARAYARSVCQLVGPVVLLACPRSAQAVGPAGDLVGRVHVQPAADPRPGRSRLLDYIEPPDREPERWDGLA
jgi:hypothetical protein